MIDYDKMHDMIAGRYNKINGLILKYETEISNPEITEKRYTQVKSYIHCFTNELEFLQTIYQEESTAEVQNFEEDDDGF